MRPGCGRPGDRAIFSDRFLPGSFDLPQLTSSRLIVRFLAILIFGVVNFFLALARGCVVRIEREHLIVSFHCKIVLARLIKAVSLGEQLFHFLNLVDEVRRDRLVEVTRLSQMRVEFLRFTAVWVITIA